MKPTFFLTSIDFNHKGDLNIAKMLIGGPVRVGCKVVTFQRRTIDMAYTQEFLAEFCEGRLHKTQRDQKNGLDFGKTEYDAFDDCCCKTGVACRSA